MHDGGLQSSSVMRHESAIMIRYCAWIIILLLLLIIIIIIITITILSVCIISSMQHCDAALPVCHHRHPHRLTPSMILIQLLITIHTNINAPPFFFLSFLMPPLTLKSLTESHSCHTPDHDMIRLSSLQCHCTYHCHCHCHCHCGDCQAEQTQRNLTGRCKRSRTTLY